MLYCAVKWLASKNDPASRFFVAHDEESNYSTKAEPERNGGRDSYGHGGYGRGGRGCGRGRGGRNSGVRHTMLYCHKCGIRGHVARSCRHLDGGAYGDTANDESDFPEDNGEILRRPPCHNEPRNCTLPNGRVVK